MSFFNFIFNRGMRTQSSISANIIGQHYTLEQLRQIPMGQLLLQPIDAELSCDELAQKAISILANDSPDIKTFLPNLDIYSPEAVAKYFTNYCMKIELGYEFGYSIKMGAILYLGFIFVHTPSSNELSIGFPKWSLDFCLFKPFENKGIMSQSIVHLLAKLKSDFGIDEIYTYISEENIKCLRLLQHLPFDLQPETLTDPSNNTKAKLYCCPLKEIDFQHR